MKMKKLVPLIMSTALLVSMLAGCTGNNSSNNNSVSNNGGEKAAEETISGEITVLTNRTDLVDTTFNEYKTKFNEKYPDVKVNFEAITDYEGQVKTRMNTTDYGDVLLIPNDLNLTELPDFFESLGTIEDLSEKYLFTDEKAINGEVYGIPTFANAQGIIYNKKVFEEAGVDKVPATPEEFIDAMKKIKENTDVVAPYYTNFAAGWPLTQWEPNRTSIAGDPEYVNTLAHTDTPFDEGTPHYILYKLMYDLVSEGLIEEDPLTTDWESSKQMIADGDIAAMVLGSWAIVQMKDLAENPDDIGYMPFPYTNEDGNIYCNSGGDYKIGINKNSENKEAARAWLDFFVDECEFAESQEAISPLKGSPMPSSLAAFDELGVKLIAKAPAPEGEEGWVEDIDNESEVGLWADNFKKRIIEAGLGNTDESFEDIMSDLNTKWADARAKVVK
ncbi:ABC transporter substrate-binding protein [Clostridium sp. DL1XJH146]